MCRFGLLMVTCGGSEHLTFTDTMFGATFFYDSHTPEGTQAIRVSPASGR